MRRARYLKAVPLLLCILSATALAFANELTPPAPNDPRQCVSYKANGAARLDMNCEGFDGRIPLNLTIPADRELEFEVGIDRELAGKHCPRGNIYAKVEATLVALSVCDECYFTAIYTVSQENKFAWYFDADGPQKPIGEYQDKFMNSATFNINGSWIAMTLPDGNGTTYRANKTDCRIDACTQQDSQKTFEFAFITTDTACGFYVKFPAYTVLFPAAPTSTAPQLLQTVTTDSSTTDGESTSATSLNATSIAAKQFRDGTPVKITRPLVDIELSLPADEPLTFKMSFPDIDNEHIKVCTSRFPKFPRTDEAVRKWMSEVDEPKLEISSGDCTLSASFKGPLSPEVFVFEGARLQRKSHVWHPLVTIRELTATLSDKTNKSTTRLPCELAFQKDQTTRRQRILLKLKADLGFCNAKLIFADTTQLLRPVAVTPAAVPVQRLTTTVLETASSESTTERTAGRTEIPLQTATADSSATVGEGASAASLNATATTAKQFIDGSSVEIVRAKVDVKLSLPADEPLSFKISFSWTFITDCNSRAFNDPSSNDIGKITGNVPWKIDLKSGSCTLSGSYRRMPHEEFDFHGARLTHQGFLTFMQPLVVIEGRNATLSYESDTQSTTLPCELDFKTEPSNRKSVVLNLKAEFGFCKTKLIFPETVQVHLIYPWMDEYGQCKKKCPNNRRLKRDSQPSSATGLNVGYQSLMVLTIPAAFLLTL